MLVAVQLQPVDVAVVGAQVFQIGQRVIQLGVAFRRLHRLVVSKQVRDKPALGGALHFILQVGNIIVELLAQIAQAVGRGLVQLCLLYTSGWQKVFVFYFLNSSLIS